MTPLSFRIAAFVAVCAAVGSLIDEDRGGVAARQAPEITMAANLVYSPVHAQVLMVQGPPASNPNIDTRVWAWDGRRWSPLDGTGPAARVLGAAAFDIARRELVLFGGIRERSNLDDLWAWSNGSWRQLTGSTVGPRDHHVMAYDTHRSRIVLFGGSGARPAGSDRRLSPEDTWEWDGTRWNQVATTGPSSRGRSAMAYDERRRQIVLFGGGGNQVLGDTWLWDGQRWQASDQIGPPARYAHALAYDADREVVVAYGGATFSPARYFADMWEWNGERWREITMPPINPGARYSPGMAYDRARRRLVLYGGAAMNPRGELAPAFDTWEWDGTRWSRMP